MAYLIRAQCHWLARLRHAALNPRQGKRNSPVAFRPRPRWCLKSLAYIDATPALPDGRSSLILLLLLLLFPFLPPL